MHFFRKICALKKVPTDLNLGIYFDGIEKKLKPIESAYMLGVILNSSLS